MSRFTTSLALLGLAAIAVAGWQARHAPEPPAELRADIPSDPIFAAALPGLPPLPARVTRSNAPEPLRLPPQMGRFGLSCGADVTARAEAPAIIILEINDACAPGRSVLISHAGIELTLETNALGQSVVHLPALSDPARISVGGQVFQLAVPDLADYQRVAVNWRGDAEISLSAFERGAASGMPGHISPSAPGSHRDAVLGEGGFLSLLDGLQVYTFPRDPVEAGGQVRLALSLCGTAEATTITIRDAAAAEHTELELAGPGCRTAAPHLWLQNLFPDLRIAER
ncbi:MAG: hypothetical protein AAGA70_01570 [Pseudomonadota bacterium]